MSVCLHPRSLAVGPLGRSTVETRQWECSRVRVKPMVAETHSVEGSHTSSISL